MASKLHEKVVEQYFKLIQGLRSGKEGSVDALVDLWDEDGVFEFAGSPPVVGTFKGKNAIRTLYKNRFKASGMPLSLSGGPKAVKERDVALGLVETRINRMRTLEKASADDASDRVAVGWTTVIGTSDKRGFEVSGSHSFPIFKSGKIASLKVVVSPKADTSKGLKLEDLHVDDIGRLSLAAWAVV